MSAIDDLDRARQAVPSGVWSWEEDRGARWTLYVNRGELIDPDFPVCGTQHGANILRGDGDTFDGNGENLRTFILVAAQKTGLLVAERDVEREAWARLLRITTEIAAEHAAGNPDWARIAALKTDHALAKKALCDLGIDVNAFLEDPA